MDKGTYRDFNLPLPRIIESVVWMIRCDLCQLLNGSHRFLDLRLCGMHYDRHWKFLARSATGDERATTHSPVLRWSAPLRESIAWYGLHR